MNDTSTPLSKWLLASHMQKAVRRGLPDEAAWAAGRLFAQDAGHARRRLATIAVEDVATASPEGVAEAFAGDWQLRALRQRGEAAFAGVAARLAALPRDRLACELWACRHWLPDFEAAVGPWEQLPPGRAIDLAWDTSRPWWLRALAAWRAVGTRGGCWDASETLPSCEGSPTMWRMACRANGIQDADFAALDTAGPLQAEPHPVFLPLAWSLRRQAAASGALATQTKPLLDLGKVGPWLSCAIDMHTGEGRRSLGLLLSENPDGRRFLATHGRSGEAASYALGHLMFWMEGGALAEAPAYPALEKVVTATKQRFLAEPRPMDGRAFFNHFRDTGAWQSARERVLGTRPGLSSRQTQASGPRP